MTPDRAREIAKKTSDQISGEWPLLMNDLEHMIESALLLAASEERARCAEICDQHASVEGIAQRIRAQILEWK